MRTLNKSLLPKAAIADYHSNGYYFPINALSPELIDDTAQRIESLLANAPTHLEHPWNLKAHLLFDWIYRLTVHPAVLDAVESVIGPNILMQAGDVFVKPGNTYKHINWHQDANYWGLEPLGLCTAWIALSDVFPENGCMRFLAGTHLNEKIDHVETFAEDSALTRGQELVLDIDEAKAVPVILKAGHSLHFNQSSPDRRPANVYNTSSGRR